MYSDNRKSRMGWAFFENVKACLTTSSIYLNNPCTSSILYIHNLNSFVFRNIEHKFQNEIVK